MTGRGESILVVDDDEAFCHTLARALARRNFSVCVAHNSEQALQQAGNATFDRIVLDLKIGADTGLRLLPQLKAAQPRADIVVLTGYSSIPTAVEAIKAGAVNYLCKPATTDAILAAFGQRTDTEMDIADEPPSVRRLEWEHIQTVLQQNNGNISKTAKDLKMHRRTLQRKLQKKPVSQ